MVPAAPGSGPGAGGDKTAPKLSFRAPSHRTLKALLKSGITLRVKCNEACKISGVLDLRVTIRTKSKGKRVRRIKVYVVGRSKTASASKADRAVTIRVKLTSSGKKRLRRVRPRLVRLTLTARDAAGNKRSAARNIKIIRR